MKALVTGGGGFIGSHIAERLCRDGHEVAVLDNFSTGRRENLAHLLADIRLIEGDIQSYERAHTAVKGCDVVFHQAALPSVPRSIQDPLTSNAVNVIGTLNVLLAARDSGIRRVVYASSSSVYGADPTLPKHEKLKTVPISPYAVAKLAGEGYCRSFAQVYGLETVALRYFNVFGPRQDPTSQYSAVIPRFITSCLEGRRPIIFGDGEQSRDFTYISNVVDANLLAANTADIGAAGEVYNVACGERTTLNEVIAQIADVTGRALKPRHEDPRPGDVRHSLADFSRAERDFAYRPSTTFRQGLERLIEAYGKISGESATSLDRAFPSG